MKKVITFLVLLAVGLSYKEGNAQPRRIWSSYYGNYTTYTPASYTVMGTAVFQVISDKKNHCIYMLGETTDSSGIATPGSFKENYLAPKIWSGFFYVYGRNVFLAKFDTSGNRVWATYYGGNRFVLSPSMALDQAGNIYISGVTNSDSGIATPGSHKPVYTGNLNDSTPIQDTRLAFLTKFAPDGHQVWGTYYGQSETGAYAMAYDSFTNAIYIAGGTADSSDIATAGSFKDSFHPGLNDISDAFIAKFDTSGNLQWGTYYGGQNIDGIKGLWTGNNGSVYAIGQTTSLYGIATPGSDVDSTAVGGSFLVKFGNNGQRQWGTYIGHNGSIDVASITGQINPESDAVYISASISGMSDSTDITPNAYQPVYGGGSTDICFLKYNGNGLRQWATYFGGNNAEPPFNLPGSNGNMQVILAHSIAVDAEGDIYMVSTTNSTQGIQHTCHPLSTSHQRSIIAKWTPDGNLLWSSYADADLIAVCAGNGGDFYIGGYTSYDSLASPGSHQPTKVANQPSGFFAKLSSACPSLSIPVSQNQDLLSVGDSFDMYQWYQDGNVISGADSNIYAVPSGDSGNYFVAVTENCGCNYHSDTVNYHTTGIYQTNAEHWALQLFPNPATGSVTFSFDLKQPETVLVSVYDLVGREILKKRYAMLSGRQKKALNVSDWQQGLYIVKFKIGGQQVVRKLEVE